MPLPSSLSGAKDLQRHNTCSLEDDTGQEAFRGRGDPSPTICTVTRRFHIVGADIIRPLPSPAGFAVVNDSPVDFQSRERTDPQGDAVAAGD